MGGEHRRECHKGGPNDGSSPRGRGTPWRPGFCQRCPRFIPAWAGNTFSWRKASRMTAVHPRVGGEHTGRRRRNLNGHGSSPRGRGTLSAFACPYCFGRFIPAWAGNTEAAGESGQHDAVHPRVGGEHTAFSRRSFCFAGSSPRGRGTLLTPISAIKTTRFIPAWAGNTGRQARQAGGPPVHPRVGGEHQTRPGLMFCGIGSSPRGRGTPSQTRQPARQSRFIPAWAGNTRARSSLPTAASVHPRVGGEHITSRTRAGSASGSSPRGRGTRRALPPV